MRIWSAAIIIAAVLIIGFALSVPHVRDLGDTAATTTENASTTPTVYIHDAYKKGIHTITAKVLLPDACTTISGDVSVIPSAASGTPDSITLALDMPPDSGICLEEPATTTLTFTVSAETGTPISATINGTDASTTAY